MTILNIIQEAAECLTLDRLAAAARLTSNQTANLSPHEAREFDILFQCTRAVIDEIGREYMPLTITVPVQTNTEGVVEHRTMPHRVLEIISVKSIAGQKLSFLREVDRIRVANITTFTTILVTYKYTPQPQSLTSRVEFDGTRIGRRLIAFGVAAEFCIRQGLIDEAALWDRRYKDALLAALRPLREKRVKARRFK